MYQCALTQQGSKIVFQIQKSENKDIKKAALKAAFFMSR